jgi:twitching motility two-component system response regulator PilH
MATILIVDDVTTNRDLLGKLVSSLGHTPIYGVSGEEAVAKAAAVKPALIFLDVVMPGLDGFGACRRIKKDPTTAGIPVVLVTQKTSESDRFWGKKQGADDHLAKPWTADQIKAMIGRFVK